MMHDNQLAALQPSCQSLDGGGLAKRPVIFPAIPRSGVSAEPTLCNLFLARGDSVV